ncbi:hypothetical protein HKCCE3408_19145 [Rhodobacterales bacterium HKCCE3408]|nr:hypothetical protein [Rhodobacterales bacterium HKCCE3408]
MAIINLTRWPAILILALAGGAATAFAFVTANLFTQAMANVGFIRQHGYMAIEEGALIQLSLLGFWGLLALIAYLVFKACEVELMFRYFNWAKRGEQPERRRFRFRRNS